MRYTIEELDLKNDTYEEAVRTRKIFDEIKTRAQNNEKIFEHEKNFFCKGVLLSKDDDGNIEDYECCNNFRFKFLYQVYFDNLTSKQRYYKPKAGKMVEVAKKEKQKDLFYLYDLAREWEGTINDTRISSELLKQVAKETRDEIKLLNLTEIKGEFEYNTALRTLLLSSRYLYIMALEIFEISNPNDMKFELNGETIEFNEYSLIHILKRHFGEVTKKYKTDKSYHSEMIDPLIMHIKLKDIFKQIDDSGVYSSTDIGKVTFILSDKLYQVWINEKTKSVSGVGNVRYKRLETFYPLENKPDIDKIHEEYELHTLNDMLGVYVKKASSSTSS